MRLWRPRSLTDLMFIGFALVAVPLLFAVIVSATKVRGLADESASLVHSGVQSAHYTQQLFQYINTMDRKARLYIVLREEPYLRDFDATTQRLLQTLGSITKASGELSPLNAQLHAVRTATEDWAKSLHSPATDDAGRAEQSSSEAFSRLSDAAGQLADATTRQIDDGLSHIQESTVETQNYLFWQSAGVILLTAILVGAFTVLIMRPIRQIDDAISQLGQGTFSKTIAVNGPSDLTALGQQLEWLRMRLLDIAQDRNRFLRHMSHELKTPLANIREGTELLLDGAVGALETAQREVGEILRDNSIKLQQLIENLLSFNAWQARHGTLELSQFRLRPLVKAALETHQLTLLAQRMHLELKVDDIELQADRAKLKLILDNLLSNALKYSPRGGTIYIRAVNEPHSKGDELVLDIADTGPGIHASERAAVFDAFYSGRAPTSGHLKGTGIGLSVVSEFVKAHGGNITIMDGQYPGAHFRIRMPVLTPEEAAA